MHVNNFYITPFYNINNIKCVSNAKHAKRNPGDVFLTANATRNPFGNTELPLDANASALANAMTINVINMCENQIHKFKN
jgi:hypothetical protein